MTLEKRESQLSSLHLYADETLLAALKRGVLPVSDDLSLLSPYLQFDQWHGERAQPVTDVEFGEELKREYDRLPENIRQLLSFDDFSAQSAKLDGSIRENVLKNRRHHSVGYGDSRVSNVSYLRLFGSALSVFGWKELADNFSGLCISLNSQSSLFQSKKGFPVLLQPVKYGESHQLAVQADNPLPGFFNDDQENTLRAEWRVAFPKSLLNSPDVKVPKNTVTQIFYSVHASETLKAEVANLVSRDIRYRSVSVYEVFPDASCWRLSARPVRT